MSRTTVVNLNKEDYDFYIGRGSLLGNPYEIDKDGTRNEVIARYRVWFRHLLKSQMFKQELLKVRGKKLGCFCSPQRCHGEVIAEFVNLLPPTGPVTSSQWQDAIKQYFHERTT